ncbi:putative holin-like toxin [Lentibacillus sp.]
MITLYQGITLMIGFGSLLIAVITLIVSLTKK